MKRLVVFFALLLSSAAFAGGSGGGGYSPAYTCADGSTIATNGGGLLLSTESISKSDDEFWEMPASVAAAGPVRTFSNNTSDNHGNYTYTPVATLSNANSNVPGAQAILKFLNTNQSQICIRLF